MKTVFLFLGLFCSGGLFSQQPGVAINTDGSAAATSALLDVKSTDKGVLVPRMTTAQRTAIANVVKGLLVFDNTTSSFWFYTGSAWTELASGGASPWAASSTNISNTNTGNVGIGMATPTAKLHVGGNLRTTGRIDAEGVMQSAGVSALGSLYVSGTSLLAGAITSSSSATFGGNINSNTSMSINDASAILQLKAAGVDKGYMQLSADDLRLGTNAGNSAGNMIVRLNGQNRFQFAPTGRLSIMADQFPTLYFNTGGVNRAYLQLLGDNIRLDAPGNKVLIGDDMTVDDATNRVGIGTTTPEQKLHVTGNAKITGGKILNNSNENMLPIAFANFNGDGIKLSGTSNLTGGWVANVFSLQCTNVDISNATILITCRNARLIPSWTPLNDFATIRFYDNEGDELRPSGFSVVVYKTN